MGSERGSGGGSAHRRELHEHLEVGAERLVDLLEEEPAEQVVTLRVVHDVRRHPQPRQIAPVDLCDHFGDLVGDLGLCQTLRVLTVVA